MATPDPYLPGHGDTRYSVRHYDLALDYKVATNHLSGRATLDVVLTEPTHEIELDLANLQVGKVTVDGRQAKVRTRPRRVIVPVGERSPGDRLTLVVPYSGKPRPVRGIAGSCGWEELTDGVLVGSQPDGSPSWFPCNDHAGVKATFRTSITVESGYTVVANGTLARSVRRGGSTTWTYVMDRPMAPYLATVQIGRYVADRRPGPVPVELFAPANVRLGAGTAFERQVDMVRLFSELFGRYPFEQYRVVVTGDPLEIPLEAQAMSSFGRNMVTPTWDHERLVAHELAHQWFGNAITAGRAEDIWLHEGFACYSEWLWSQASGKQSTQQWAAHHHASLARQPKNLAIGRPGPRDMFDDRVYKRGALTVHAVRAALGEERFWPVLRSWVSEHDGGVVSTPLLVEHVRHATGVDIAPLLDQWLYQSALPPLPVI